MTSQQPNDAQRNGNGIIGLHSEQLTSEIVRSSSNNLSFSAPADIHAHLNATLSSSRQNNGDNDMNTIIIWLRYVIFAVVLLGLIALSFVRFHYKRGLQYRLRQVELDRKRRDGSTSGFEAEGARRLLHSSSMFDNDEVDSPLANTVHYAFPSEAPVGGNYSCLNDNGVGSKQFSTRHTVRIAVGDRYSDITAANHVVSESSRDKQRQQQQQRRRANHTGNGNDRRQPVVFTFNANGSMVDVRCCEDEDGDVYVNNTFRFDNGNSVDGDVTTCSVIDLETAAAEEATQLEDNNIISANRRRKDRHAHYDNYGDRARWEYEGKSRNSQILTTSQSVNGGHLYTYSNSDSVVRLHSPSLLPNRNRPANESAAVAAAEGTAATTSPSHRQSLNPSSDRRSPLHQSFTGRNHVNVNIRPQQQQQHHQPLHVGNHNKLLSPHHHPHRSRNRHHYHHRDMAGSTVFHASLFVPRAGSSDEEIRRNSVAAEALQLWQKRV